MDTAEFQIKKLDLYACFYLRECSTAFGVYVRVSNNIMNKRREVTRMHALSRPLTYFHGNRHHLMEAVGKFEHGVSCRLIVIVY